MKGANFVNLIVKSKSILKNIIFILVLLLGLIGMHNEGPVRAGNDTWTPAGLYGGTIQDIAISPENPQVIYATTIEPGVFKSTDAGSTWQLMTITGCAPWYGSRIFLDEENPSSLYFVGLREMCISHNNGQTWEAKPIDRPTGVDLNPAVISSEMSTLTGTIIVGTDMGMSRSTDYGETWEPTYGPEMFAITMAPSAPYIIYAGGSKALLKSLDNGKTWQNTQGNFIQVPQVYSITVDPSNADVVYIGTADNGIFKTTDGGQNWAPIGNGLASNCIWDIQIYPENQQVIYVGGGTPNFFPSSPGVPGVYRSLDNLGLSWESMMDGMGSKAIRSLAIDNGSPRTLYAGTSGSGIWKYTLINAPQDFSVSINNGSLFTNNTNVTLALTAPSSTDQVMISNDGGFSGAVWEQFAAEKSWQITSYGSAILPRTVYVKFKTSGQISPVYQDDIILDITPPEGSVKIEQLASSSSIKEKVITGANSANTYVGYLPVVGRNFKAGFKVVHLSLQAVDDLSGVDSMLIDYDPSFSHSQWEPFAANVNVNVPIQDLATVYVKFRDRAGNISQAYSASEVSP